MAMVIAARPLVAECTITIVFCSQGLPALLVADAAPDIDDLLAVVIDRAGAAELVAPGKVVRECVPHRLEAGADVSLNGDGCRVLP